VELREISERADSKLSSSWVIFYLGRGRGATKTLNRTVTLLAKIETGNP
jgi:hypothetical protein